MGTVDCPSCSHSNPEGAKFCNECAAPLNLQKAPEQRSHEVEGERRQLTVMFCDLVGSTALSEHLDPEDFGEVIAVYQAVCRRSVGPRQTSDEKILKARLHRGSPALPGSQDRRASGSDLGSVLLQDLSVG